MPYNLLNNSLEIIICLCFKWQAIKKRLDKTQHGKAYKDAESLPIWSCGQGGGDVFFPRVRNFSLGQPAEQPGGTQQPTAV
jgi:hypothetical protein